MESVASSFKFVIYSFESNQLILNMYVDSSPKLIIPACQVPVHDKTYFKGFLDFVGNWVAKPKMWWKAFNLTFVN